MSGGYPDNLPDSTPPPSDPTPEPSAPAPQSTYDTLKNRGRDIDAQVDRATGGKPTIERGTHNPDNNLPDRSDIFHRARGLYQAYTE